MAKTVAQLTKENEVLKETAIELMEAVDILLQRTEYLKEAIKKMADAVKGGFVEVKEHIDYNRMEMVDEIIRTIRKEIDDNDSGEEWKKQ